MFLGEDFPVFADWFFISFTENNGMAFGLEFEGAYGKYLLTFFRIFAVAGIGWYLNSLVKEKAPAGFIVSVAMIMAGALGNIIDSVFYGVAFSEINTYPGGWFQGRVVDMLYFPIVSGFYPSWFPFVGGEDFLFFRPVFNVADASISIGVALILLFQKSFFHKPEKPSDDETTDIPDQPEPQETITPVNPNNPHSSHDNDYSGVAAQN